MPDATSPVSSMDEHEIVRMIDAQRRTNPARRGWRCPSAEQVAAYLDQRLAADDKARFEAHLAHCDFCIGFVSSLVQQPEAKEQVEVPAALVRQAIDAVPKNTSAGRSWRWVLAPALASIVVVSAVLLKRPQPAQIRQPDVSAPTVSETSPPTSAPVAKSESRPAGAPEVRSLKTPSKSLQLLEPRSGSIVRAEELRFRWRPVSMAVYYEIRVVNSEGDPVWRAESAEPAAQVPGNLSFMPGKYFVWISAHLSDGRTLKSDTIAFQILSSG
jgi:hypothetical protein